MAVPASKRLSAANRQEFDKGYSIARDLLRTLIDSKNEVTMNGDPREARRLLQEARRLLPVLDETLTKLTNEL